jgi:hypothetical protein
MSGENLIEGVKPTLQRGTTMSDGVIVTGVSKGDWWDAAIWRVQGTASADERTVHLGASVRWHGASSGKGTVYLSTAWYDSNGNAQSTNVSLTKAVKVTGEWQRVSLSAQLPAGARLYNFHVGLYYADTALEVSNPVVSYGSPVTLAAATHECVETEWLRLGEYSVDQPDSYGGTIQLDCLDGLTRFERPFTDVSITYPAELPAIVRAICSACSVPLSGSSNEVLLSYSSGRGASVPDVSRMPNASSMTCLDALSYALQAMCMWARMDQYGELEVGWYPTSAFEDESWLAGGTFGSSATADSADGGTLSDTKSGDSADGGDFFTPRTVPHLLDWSDLTVFTDDVVVTGIQVTAQNEVVVGSDGKEQNGRDGETALSGSAGYVLKVEGNPFIEYGTASAYAASIAAAAVGMRFRPFQSSCSVSPAVEAGDAIVVVDRRNNTYRSYVTSVSLVANGQGTIRCSAESAARNSAASASAQTATAVAARKAVRREQNARELAQSQLAKRISDAAGLYSTEQTQSDGSVVHMLHDRPTLADSRIVWKMTATAVAVSTDGGKTFTNGVTADGDAILNRVYAIGLDADHVTAGTIRSRDGKSWWNLDTGEVVLSSSATIGGLSSGTINSNINGVKSTANATATLIRQYGSGVLVCRTNQSLGALVNPSGSFDVVKVAWSNGVPSVSGTITTFGAKSVSMLSGLLSVETTSEINSALITATNLYLRGTLGTTIGNSYPSGKTTILGGGGISIGGADVPVSVNNRSFTPVYRAYNQYDKTYILTASLSEYNSIVSAGWTGDGVTFYAFG